jgi:hypothetical protein
MSETAHGETGKVELEIRKGADAQLRLGGLKFVACRREVDTIDGGITLIVWSDQSDTTEEEQELLRFDFFRNRPHYHSPAANQAETQIDAQQYGDGRAWGIEQLTTSARELVSAAGFEQIAAKLDGAALAGGGEAMESLLGELGEPVEVSYFAVDAAIVERLRESA